jgi:hypothetical protein
MRLGDNHSGLNFPLYVHIDRFLMIVCKESSRSSHVGLRIVNNFGLPLNLGKEYFRDGEHYLDYEPVEVNIAKTVVNTSMRDGSVICLFTGKDGICEGNINCYVRVKLFASLYFMS